MYCNTAAPDWKDFRAKYNREYFERAENKDDGETLYVDTRWVVLYANEDQKIPIERIQDCLKMLNMIFSGKNTDELAKVPDTKYNPWKDRVGNPNIQFLPLDESTLQVEYKSVSGNLDGKAPVDDASKKGGVVDGVLNIYLGSSGKSSILGQAQLSHNIVYALYSAIGGYTKKGTLPGYDLGKTVAHEVGHALSLVHTFSDTSCDGFSPYTDVPETIRPNFNTELFELAPGVWDQRGDNRYNDRLNGTQVSCLHTEPDPSNAPNDMGINIMDYGDDEVSIIFSQNQALMMREYLKSSDNTTLQLKSADDQSISAGGSSGSGADNTTSSGTSSGSGGGTELSSTSTTNGINIAVIVVVSVFGVLVFVLIVWIMYRFYPRSSASHTRKKLSSQYLTYY